MAGRTRFSWSSRVSGSASALCSGRLTDAAGAADLNESLIERLVGASASRAWFVVSAVTILCALTTQYVVSHFAMTTLNRASSTRFKDRTAGHFWSTRIRLR
jgi:Ni/Fe-hydrogenase subunit HybB-like protein